MSTIAYEVLSDSDFRSFDSEKEAYRYAFHRFADDPSTTVEPAIIEQDDEPMEGYCLCSAANSHILSHFGGEEVIFSSRAEAEGTLKILQAYFPETYKFHFVCQAF